MPFFTMRKRSVFGLGVLCLIAVCSFIGLRASDTVGQKELDSAMAPTVNPTPLNVRENNLDASGHIKVHEQGVVSVQGTINVGNSPSVQNVRIVNDPLEVDPTGEETVRFFNEELTPFDKDADFVVDIAKYSRVRVTIIVNGSDSTVDVFYGTDAHVGGSFSVDTSDTHTVLLPELPGTRLFLQVRDPDGEQVFVWLFGRK
jgi:hypothetical protein